jgi:hypothetical protein
VINTTVAAIAVAGVIVTPTSTSPQPSIWPDLAPMDTWGMTVADWNDDDAPDVLMINHRDGYPQNRPDWHDLLVVSDGNTWRVELELPFADRHGCAAVDADGNGRLDFFCAVGSSPIAAHDGLGPNELWLQDADGWVEAAAAWGIDDPPSRGRYVTTVDWNDDGRDDLFVGTAPRSDMERHPAVWINRGDRFTSERVDHWGTNCAVPWRGGVVVCDVGPLLGTTAWWLRPGEPSVNLGAYHNAAVTGDNLVLLAGDHVSIVGGEVEVGTANGPVRGERVNLPRPARDPSTPNIPVSERGRASVFADDNVIYVVNAGCSADPAAVLPDMVVTGDERWTVADVPGSTGCTTTAQHLGDGRVLISARTTTGQPVGIRIWDHAG